MNDLAKSTLALAAAGVVSWLLSRMVPARQRYDFRNRVVFINGGSRGLGLVMARQLAEEGARLALCARDEEELQRAADDLRQKGPAPFIHRCDVSNPGQVQETVRAIESRLGPIY